MAERVIYQERVDPDGAQWVRIAGPNNGDAPGAVAVSQAGVGKSASITRPSDTNIYAAGDVVGAATGSSAAIEFPNLRGAAGEFMFTGTELEIDASAVISGETSYRLDLYSVTPPSAYGDNAAWDLPSGDRASYLGYLELGSPVDQGSTLYVQTDGINKQVTLAGTGVFGYLRTTTSYTPTSGRVYKVTLHGVPF